MKKTFASALRSIALLCCACCLVPAGRATAANFMVQMEVDGQRVEGRPIFWSNSIVQMILRDGQFYELHPKEAKNFRRSSDQFRPYDLNEMRARLATEFGNDFDVSITGHYVVVHPKGQKDLWAPRFENLYRSFVHYFSVREYKLKEPEYPLVAIVWKNQQEYLKYAGNHGGMIDPKVLGYYSQVTNRVHLYDAKTLRGASNWQQNASTVIHEVTHQTAFNTGVHTRFTQCPRWLIEGLGTLFEARGTHSSRDFPNKADRINRGRLAEFHHFFPNGIDAAYFANLISTDQPFDRDMSRAYAASWAFTFYLVETQQRRYVDFLAVTAARKAGTTYPEAARLADFTKIFGNNLPLIVSQFNRFMIDLK